MQWLGDDAVPSWLRFTPDGGATRASAAAGGRDSAVFEADAAVLCPASVVDADGGMAENDCDNVAPPAGPERLKASDAKPPAVPAPALSKEQTRDYNNCIKTQKACRAADDLAGQIEALQGALRIVPGNDRVAAKLAKLQAKKAKREQRADADAVAKQLEKLTQAAAAAKEAPAANETGQVAAAQTTTTVDGWTHRAGSKMYKLDGGEYRLPAEVFEKLFRYQRDGVKWMWGLHRDGHGGVCADDMGLGKTVQVAAFLRGLFASEQVETVLIVMPKSVVENWCKELQHWTKRVVRIYDGTKAQRERAVDDVAQTGGVLLTTYGMVRTNFDKLVALENPETGDYEPWDYIILDEGHKIKNNASEGAKSVKQIGATHRLVLTGTPVLNHLMELWSLFDFVQPGLLGEKASFRKNFDEPIVRASHKNAKYDHKYLGQSVLAKLKAVIQPHFLRRVKDEVFSQRQDELAQAVPALQPSVSDSAMEKYRIRVRKNDFIVWISLSTVQLELYQRFLYMPEVKEILNTSKSPLAAITVLKKICQHPRLLRADMKALREGGDGGGGAAAALPSMDGVKQLLERVADDGEDVVAQSGKLAFLVQLMAELLRKGHRVLIFSQWQKMLDLIGQVLNERGWAYYRIDGNMSKTEERQKLLDKFNANEPGACNVFLLTTQVGGLGITLTGADRAIIYDPSWNPVDDQAVDRIYRIGQTRNCVVYRLITCGTVEEKIYRKQVFKGGLSRMVSSASSASDTAFADFGIRYFTKEELRALFTLEDPFHSATQQQLQEKHASRRVTDAELDEHLRFLATIGNMHGVSDHDLLFDGKAPADPSDEMGGDGELAQPTKAARAIDQQPAQPPSNEADTSLARLVLENYDEHEAAAAHNASVALVNDMSVVLGDADCSVVLYDDDDDNGSGGGNVAPGAVLRSPSPPPKPTKRADSPQPDFRSYNKAVLDARDLEQRGDVAGALSAYMALLEPGGGASKSRDTELVQKIVFLKQQLVRDAPPAETRAAVVAADGADDDVELFDEDDDDDVRLLNTLQRALVLDSPAKPPPVPAAVPAAAPAEDKQQPCRECVICWERERSAAFLPCGHLVACAPCAKNLTKCPVCRGTIASTLAIFLT